MSTTLRQSSCPSAARIALKNSFTLLGVLVGARAEQLDEQGLLGVEAVLGLVVDDRARAVEHGVGYLLAAVGRQAVHHQGPGAGGVEQGVVDLVRGEDRPAQL